MKLRFLALIAGGAFLASSCATAGSVASEQDPLEPFNRKMYAFNDAVDHVVLEPAAKGYRAVTTPIIREGVSNFVENLGEPVTFVNNVLQGRLPSAAGTAGRFVINTTAGVGGVVDTASAVGIQRTKADFGQTLGLWGVAPGPYLVLPFLGSSSPRDLVGTGADVAFDPLTWTKFDGRDTLRITKGVLGVLSAREAAIETVDDVRSSQLDPYTTLRRFYVRNRAMQTHQGGAGQDPDEQVPDSERKF